jgi:hypothetical protein
VQQRKRWHVLFKRGTQIKDQLANLATNESKEWKDVTEEVNEKGISLEKNK